MLYTFTAPLKKLIFPLPVSRTPGPSFKIFLLELFYFSITCLCTVLPLDCGLTVIKLCLAQSGRSVSVDIVVCILIEMRALFFLYLMVAAYSVCALPTCHGTRHQVIVFWPNSFLLQAPGTSSLKLLLPMLGQVRSARRLSSLGVAPNHQLTGAGPVAQLLGPLVETSLRPVLCRLPEVPSRREIHLLRAVTCSLMYPLVTFLPYLTCPPPKSITCTPILVLGLILGNSNSVQL